jgi:hypothetical protein
MSATAMYVDQVLVHWGEDFMWQERKPVIKGRDETLRLWLNFGRSAHARQRAPGESPLTPKAVRDHLESVVRRTRQVVVKVTGGGGDMKRIGAHMDYIARTGRYKKRGEEEIELESEDGTLFKGKDDLEMLKDQWRLGGAPISQDVPSFVDADGRVRKSRREALNVIFSMPGGVDPEKVVAASRATAKELFANHQYVIAHHGDTNNPHAHVTVKMVGFDGQRLNPRKADLEQWRIEFAKQLNVRGVEAVATRRRTRLKRDKGESQAVREMKDRGMRPQRESTALTQAVARARALDNDKRISEAYRQIAQALASSPEPADRALAQGIKNLMKQHGVSIKLTPTRKPGI